VIGRQKLGIIVKKGQKKTPSMTYWSCLGLKSEKGAKKNPKHDQMAMLGGKKTSVFLNY
jgi:hypothetical protein